MYIEQNITIQDEKVSWPKYLHPLWNAARHTCSYRSCLDILTQTYLVMHGHDVVCKFGAGMKDEFPRDMEWKVDLGEV